MLHLSLIFRRTYIYETSCDTTCLERPILLGIRPSDWCSVSKMWIWILLTVEQKMSAQKFNSNSVGFNFQTYIFIEPLFEDHLSWKTAFYWKQTWFFKTGFIVLSTEHQEFCFHFQILEMLYIHCLRSLNSSHL